MSFGYVFVSSSSNNEHKITFQKEKPTQEDNITFLIKTQYLDEVCSFEKHCIKCTSSNDESVGCKILEETEDKLVTIYNGGTYQDICNTIMKTVNYPINSRKKKEKRNKKIKKRAERKEEMINAVIREYENKKTLRAYELARKSLPVMKEAAPNRPFRCTAHGIHSNDMSQEMYDETVQAHADEYDDMVKRLKRLYPGDSLESLIKDAPPGAKCRIQKNDEDKTVVNTIESNNILQKIKNEIIREYENRRTLRAYELARKSLPVMKEAAPNRPFSCTAYGIHSNDMSQEMYDETVQAHADKYDAMVEGMRRYCPGESLESVIKDAPPGAKCRIQEKDKKDENKQDQIDRMESLSLRTCPDP